MSNEDKKRQERIFEHEFMPHIDALKTFAYHLCYDESRSDDLVQETYMKAFRFIDKYQEGTNSKAWLFKILKNAYINEYRKKSSRPRQVDFEEITTMQGSLDIISANSLDLREDIFNDMMGDEVTLAINMIPVDFRSIIMLCDVEGFTYEEIAKILEIPIGTVRSRIFRARNLLKEKLKSYAEKMGYKDLRGGGSRTSTEEE